jgi:predicted nucleic acid-binding protein
MGLILDSSVLITAERQGKNARQVLSAMAKEVRETEIGISVITLLELAHGAARADIPERKSKREQFIDELMMAMPIYPVSAPMALRARQLDGQNQARGVRVPLADLLIGISNLDLT